MDPLVDLADVQRLIDIVQRHGLAGVTVVEDDVEIAITAEPPLTTAGAVAPSAGRPPEVAAPSRYYQLKSPITGVFYRSSAPSEPPFAKEGDLVDEIDTVCLIEAMKIFNEITAGIHGRIVRVVAANEQLVVTGEVLMEIDPDGGAAE